MFFGFFSQIDHAMSVASVGGKGGKGPRLDRLAPAEEQLGGDIEIQFEEERTTTMGSGVDAELDTKSETKTSPPKKKASPQKKKTAISAKKRSKPLTWTGAGPST